ncbi:MAG: GntR family transcriptional regulator [Deinococcus sp.]
MRAPAPVAAQGSWPLSIDRALAVPVGAQLRGQIEYGIACGEIERGAKLPSVRELAHDLGVAHMTVAQVYKELGSLGLIVTSPGRGTFVADAPRQGNTPDLGPLRELVDEALERAGLAGYTPRQVSEVLNVLLARGGPSLQTGVNVLLVGLFRDATAAYAEGLGALLRPEDRVLAVTLEELRLGEGRPRAQAADVVLSLAHRLAETRALLPGVEVIPVGFIPSDATRTRLASLSPLIRLAVVATFEEFLPTFLAGVRRFAPHVLELRPSHVHAPDLREVLDGCDAAVYATGSSVVPDLAQGKPSFEYRHTIDPRDIQRLVLPAVEAARPPAASP